MPKYSYNGLELPAIPDRDAEKYPYAIITSAGIENFPYYDAHVIFLSQPVIFIEDLTADDYSDSRSYLCTSAACSVYSYNYDGEWTGGAGKTVNTVNADGFYFVRLAHHLVWANHDVIDPAGNIVLPASDPVPVGGEPEEPETPTTHTEWQKQDAYKPNTEWNGKTFYRVMGGKWVKQDVVVPQVVEVEPDVPEPEKPTNWLTFSSAEPFTIGEYNATKRWDGTLYYSTDTETWNEWDGATAISSAEHDGEQRLYMRGKGNTKITGIDSYKCRWVLTGSNISCNGNIENLLDYEIVENGEHPVMAEYCYARMFYSCTSLTKAPELPATTMARCCYYHMFGDCTSLTKAPELPATNLAKYCYFYMFRDCTSLTKIPELPATTLAPACYADMFYGCASIKLSTTQSDEYPNAYRIPTSGTGTTADNALDVMFKGTGGTFAGTPSINTTYYTSNTVV